ncbi:MAG TPA: universal stress protein [Syntrophomonadaceae bacterium]|nr:universal stress protein [Syntrophomonadaceae bacterium]
MEKILVAVDGSKNAARALMKAKQIGTAFNSEITILYVMEDIMSHPYVYTVDEVNSLENIFEKQSVKVLDAALEGFKDYNNKVNTLTKSGSPGLKIIEVAEEGAYTLIIMGSRGLGVISGAIMGSVSNKVVNKAKVSVLIVK